MTARRFISMDTAKSNLIRLNLSPGQREALDAMAAKTRGRRSRAPRTRAARGVVAQDTGSESEALERRGRRDGELCNTRGRRWPHSASAHPRLDRDRTAQ